MIQISFEKKQSETVVDALQNKIDALVKLMEKCLKEKQTDAASKINSDIKALMAIKDEIEQKAGLNGNPETK